MKLHEYDRAVSLCVDIRYPQSRNRLEPLFKNKGVILEYYLNGVDDIDRIGIDKYNFIHCPETSKFHRHAIAFKNVINQAIKDNLKNILIVEDDVNFIPDFDTILDEAIPQIPDDWNLLYYGAYHNWSETDIVSKNILKLRGSVGIHCLGIKNNMFDILSNLYCKKTMDTEIGRIHHLYPSYAIWPSLSVQIGGISSVTGEYSDCPHLFDCKGTNHQ